MEQRIKCDFFINIHGWAAICLNVPWQSETGKMFREDKAKKTKITQCPTGVKLFRCHCNFIRWVIATRFRSEAMTIKKYRTYRETSFHFFLLFLSISLGRQRLSWKLLRCMGFLQNFLFHRFRSFFLYPTRSQNAEKYRIGDWNFILFNISLKILSFFFSLLLNDSVKKCRTTNFRGCCSFWCEN